MRHQVETRFTGLLRLLTVGLLAWPGAAVLAQGTGQASIGQIPTQAQIGSGSRLTYYASTASVRGTRQQAVWKPNCNPAVEDCWIDVASGRSIGQQEVATSSGHGLTRVDIIYLDQERCVGRVTSYGADTQSGSIVTMGTSGFATTGGACVDYWVNPQHFANLQLQNSGGTQVLRGPYQVGNQVFEAVSIGTVTDGASSHRSYGAASGLLLVASTRTQGGGVSTVGPGGIATGAGNALLTYTQLLDVRTPFGVAAIEALPDHVQRSRRLVYACQSVTGMQGMSDVAPMQTPCQYEVIFADRTAAWALARTILRSANLITGVPDVSESTAAIVAGGPGGFFASPNFLQGLTQGQVLDQDQLAARRSYVGQVDAGFVTIVEEAAFERLTAVYDRRSGWLVRFSQEQLNGLGFTRLSLELTGVE